MKRREGKNEDYEEEQDDQKNDNLITHTANTARFGKLPTTTSTSPQKTSSVPYNPTRHKVCGMAQKECHQA